MTYRRGLLPYYRLFVPSWFWIFFVVTDVVVGVSWISLFVTALFGVLVGSSVFEHRRSYLRFADGKVVVHRAFRSPEEFTLASTSADFVRRPMSQVRLLRIREGGRSLTTRSVADVVSPLQATLAIRPSVAAELRSLGLAVRE